MTEKNGKTFTILMYILGILVTLVLVIGAPMLVSAVVSNDEKSRQRDTDIELRVCQKLDKYQEILLKELKELNKNQTDMKVDIREIKIKQEAK